MKILKLFFLTAMLGLSVSCLKQSESIDPIAPVKTLAEIQREAMMTTALEAAGNSAPSEAAKIDVETSPADDGVFYLNMKYKIRDLDVFETSGIPNSFEQLGNSFLKLLAKVFLKIVGERTVNIGNVDIAIPDLNLDFQIIRSIKIKRVHLEYNKEFESDFAFIKSFAIARLTGEKILSYQKSSNHCKLKCLDFIVENGNILDLIKDADTVKIKPTLSISSLPKINEIRLDGDVALQIGLKLPF